MSRVFRLPDAIRALLDRGENEDFEPGARRELKFLLPHQLCHRDPALYVRSRIPALGQSHPPRRVSSVYFDSATYRCYAQSNSGQSERVKMRLRWYGALDAHTTYVLELKHRRNHHGWKRQRAIPGLDLRTMSWTALRGALLDQIPLPQRLVVERLRFPVLAASYLRHYFVTLDQSIRVTVDDDLQFFDQRWRLLLNQRFDGVPTNHAVVECKFDPAAERDGEELLRPLALRQTRFSKYCAGVEKLSLH